jgi:hypothetical protein
VVLGRSLWRLLSEVTEQSDHLERLRREMHSLTEAREYILATARLLLSHPARKGHLDEMISRRRSRQNSN